MLVRIHRVVVASTSEYMAQNAEPTVPVETEEFVVSDTSTLYCSWSRKAPQRQRGNCVACSECPKKLY